jgi:carbamoyltransferase
MNHIDSTINVLGLNLLFHDSAAVMLKNGVIAAALEEERWFRDDKHTAIFPRRSIIYCLESIGCLNGDLHHVAINMDPIRCLSNSSSPIDLFFHPHKWNKKHWKNYLIRKQACKDVVWQMRRTLIDLDIDQQFQFHLVPHHDSHAASAFFVSPFEEAAVLTIDANGEWPTLTTSIGRGNRLQKLASIGLPNSIGGFYASITEHLGFKRNNDEFKVMGLAGYGDPTYHRKAMQELIFATDDGFFRINPCYFDYSAYKISPKPLVAGLLGCSARRKGEEINEYHKSIAAALQEHTENIVIHIARNLQKKTGLKKLCLAGGVALNCVMNSAILENTDFEEVFIQPAAHDAGSALGAASWVYHQVLNRPREYVMDRVDFGPSYSDDRIESILKSGMLKYQRSRDIAKDTARLIADGNIVGWFQGRAEFGPRALGYRSILADPTDIGMQDHLNLRVKHREDFRPFAPASTIEDFREYFETDAGDPFMTKICNVRMKYREALPSVTHIDSSARLQTVCASINPLFHKVIDEFKKIKGIPVVINTSFNINGEPMVLSPRDAIRCFYSTGIDCLVIGSFILHKN